MFQLQDFLPPRPVIVIALGEKANSEAVYVASQLRQQGLTAITATNDGGKKSLKAQLRYASSMNAWLVYIIGDNEIEKEHC